MSTISSLIPPLAFLLDEMPPFGRPREPLYGIKRADAIIITRADRPFDQGQIQAIIRYYCGDKAPVIYFYSTIARLRHLATGEVYDAKSTQCGSKA